MSRFSHFQTKFHSSSDFIGRTFTSRESKTQEWAMQLTKSEVAMDGIQSVGTLNGAQSFHYEFNAHIEVDSQILGGLSDPPTGSDTVDTSLSSLYEGLTKTSASIIDKINELLKAKAPKRVEELKPEEVTPEATARQIIKGVAALFPGFEKSNPNLSKDELIDRFMSAVRKGVQGGYDDAFDTLKGLGAFEVDGVQGGVEKTKTLLEKELSKLEERLRKRYSQTDESVEDASGNITKDIILKKFQQPDNAAQLNLVA